MIGFLFLEKLRYQGVSVVNATPLALIFSSMDRNLWPILNGEMYGCAHVLNM